MNFINEINDILWTYILIIMLLGCAVWFSIRTRFVQFRMLREMIVLLSESAGKGKQGEKHVSSFRHSLLRLPAVWARATWQGWPPPSPSADRELFSGCGRSPCWELRALLSNLPWHSYIRYAGRTLLSEARLII